MEKYEELLINISSKKYMTKKREEFVCFYLDVYKIYFIHLVCNWKILKRIIQRSFIRINNVAI